MPSKRLLRTLLVAELFLIVVAVVASFLTESLLPEPLRAYMEAEWEADFTTRDLVDLAVSIPLLLLALVSMVGLFLFWRPARPLYLVTTAAGLFLTPFFGPYVDAGWETAFGEAATIISGMVLALVYFSPLKELFEKPKIAG